MIPHRVMTMKWKDKFDAVSQKNRSLLCVGLDPDLERLPVGIDRTDDGVVAFLTSIIDATAEYVCAYKPNLAFFEALGTSGWEVLKKTLEAIPDEIPVIADAKRGDIGNTAKKYAGALFDTFGFDATTINPLMGFDSVEPFLEYHDKCLFLLCLTSNKGAEDFEIPNKLYLEIARKAKQWNTHENIGLVVGATYPKEMGEIRVAAGDTPILIPGIGAQGGELEASLQAALLPEGDGVIINTSRSVLYASNGSDFKKVASKTAKLYRDHINTARDKIRKKERV